MKCLDKSNPSFPIFELLHKSATRKARNHYQLPPLPNAEQSSSLEGLTESFFFVWASLRWCRWPLQEGWAIYFNRSRASWALHQKLGSSWRMVGGSTASLKMYGSHKGHWFIDWLHFHVLTLTSHACTYESMRALVSPFIYHLFTCADIPWPWHWHWHLFTSPYQCQYWCVGNSVLSENQCRSVKWFTSFDHHFNSVLFLQYCFWFDIV